MNNNTLSNIQSGLYMKFAIIAAGEGSRLKDEGVTTPKPLVNINGIPMIERLIQIFHQCMDTEIIIIINERMTEVTDFINSLKKNYNIKLRIKSTPSSMHSLYEIRNLLKDDCFCLTTVDTIFKPEYFKQYINAFLTSDCDGLMGVTNYIEDEKPLYVDIDNDYVVKGYYDSADYLPSNGIIYISAGVYCLKPTTLKILENCIEAGMSRMRTFQREMVTQGMKLKAFDLNKVYDIDHKEDIIKACFALG